MKQFAKFVKANEASNDHQIIINSLKCNSKSIDESSEISKDKTYEVITRKFRLLFKIEKDKHNELLKAFSRVSNNEQYIDDYYTIDDYLISKRFYVNSIGELEHFNKELNKKSKLNINIPFVKHEKN